MTDYGPSLIAAKLYRRVSSKGTTYFSGRWGLLKVALLKDRTPAPDGTEIWNLVVSTAPPRTNPSGDAGDGAAGIASRPPRPAQAGAQGTTAATTYAGKQGPGIFL